MVRTDCQIRRFGRRAGGRRPIRIRGFTLIEILVVVVVLAIASAIAIPQFASNDDLVAASASRTIMADLLYAQNRAIATQQYHYVLFNVSNQNYSLYSSGTSNPLAPPTQLPLTHPVNLNPYTMTFGGTTNSVGNVTLKSVNFGNNQSGIAFDPTGTPYYYTPGSGNTALSGSGTIQISAGAYALTINVAQDTGDISVN